MPQVINIYLYELYILFLVRFRQVVFKPYINEVITGTITKCSIEGIQVSLDFFDDIIIPPENIPQPSKL